MSAFTTSYPNIVRSIVTEIGIVTGVSGSSTQVVKCKALWDTGAVYSVVSADFARKLGLTSFDSGRAYTAQGSYDTSVYLLDIFLPNGMIVKDLRVSDGTFQDFDFLLGMDVISLGDFTITNKEATKFTFRIPAEGIPRFD